MVGGKGKENRYAGENGTQNGRREGNGWQIGTLKQRGFSTFLRFSRLANGITSFIPLALIVNKNFRLK